MNQFQLFLPCAAGVEEYLLPEVQHITGLGGQLVQKRRGGVAVTGAWRDVMLLNLYSRLAQRVLVLLSYTEYRNEQDLYRAASEVAWEAWFTPRQSIKVEVTAQHSPLTSLNFAALKVKDALCDRFRVKANGVRPDVDTQWPDVRIFAHLSTDSCSLYIDTSGEPLFKRGWRHSVVEAPLRENLAAGIIRLSGWKFDEPLFDPMCGGGTLLIEAAAMALNEPPGAGRNFAFERLLSFDLKSWNRVKDGRPPRNKLRPTLFGSDIEQKAVESAKKNLMAAGFFDLVKLQRADILKVDAPAPAGVMVANPPYGERLSDADEMAAFYPQLGNALKARFAGWHCHFFTADLRMAKMIRLSPSRRVPLFNGALECRLFEFVVVAGSNRKP